MQYHYTSMRMAKMKKKSRVDKVVENLGLLYQYIVCGNVNLYKHFANIS